MQERFSTGTFQSLRNFNYRIWASGSIISSVGTWMQRTAQDWIVLTQLTDHNATSVGFVMALQFGPQMLLLPFTGFAADYFNTRKLLLATQAAMGALALGLGILTISGMVQLWHVYMFALSLGCVSAFDAPARQTFVSQLVADTDLPNAVALNSTSFNVARMIGPAVAGILIARIGSGWVFIINALSFLAVIISLSFLRKTELRLPSKAKNGTGSFFEGFHYVWKREDLKTILMMFFLIGTFGFNFAIYISTMSVTAFHAGASQYGLLTSMMAIGSVTGALLSARRSKPQISILLLATAIFGSGLLIASIMPNYWLFGFALLIIGIAAQTFTTNANSLVQLATEPAMRGRVMAIVLAISLGGTPLGAPIVGWVTDRFGPRWGLEVGAAAGFIATLVGIGYLVKHRRLRLRFELGRPIVLIDEDTMLHSYRPDLTKSDNSNSA